jgi:hypothetical protein
MGFYPFSSFRKPPISGTGVCRNLIETNKWEKKQKLGKNIENVSYAVYSRFRAEKSSPKWE